MSLSTSNEKAPPTTGPGIRNANAFQLQISPNGLPQGPRQITNGSLSQQMPQMPLRLVDLTKPKSVEAPVEQPTGLLAWLMKYGSKSS